MKLHLAKSVVLAVCLAAGCADAARATKLTGVVQDGTGAVIPFARVELHFGKREASVKVDDLGRFQLLRLSSGVYDMEVEANGFLPWVVRGLRVGSSNVPPATVAMMVRESGGMAAYGSVRGPAAVTGFILQRTSALAEPEADAGHASGAVGPVAGVRVSLIKYGWSRPAAPVETDEWGAFSLSDLRPGEYALRTSKPGYADCEILHIKAEPGRVLHFGLIMGKGSARVGACSGSAFGGQLLAPSH